MLNERIGTNAGIVWNALTEGELSAKAIKKTTKLTEKDLSMALGWLSREGKVTFTEQEGELTVTLVN